MLFLANQIGQSDIEFEVRMDGQICPKGHCFGIDFYLCVDAQRYARKRIYHGCGVLIQNVVPRVQFSITQQSLVMPNFVLISF